jgi:hypothetical protein
MLSPEIRHRLEAPLGMVEVIHASMLQRLSEILAAQSVKVDMLQIPSHG